jgi:hypothetical protein
MSSKLSVVMKLTSTFGLNLSKCSNRESKCMKKLYIALITNLMRLMKSPRLTNKMI